MPSPPRPARVPVPVFTAAGYFLPRLMFLPSRFAPQVQWGDVALALRDFPGEELDLGSAGFWDEWRTRWVAQAQRYRDLAAASSTRAGRARAFRTASACYHWAEFMDFRDPASKLALRRQVREYFRYSIEGADLDLSARRVRVGTAHVPYWLVLPDHPAPGPLPCVVLSNGLDSMTEVEILALAETYLERGIAAVLFEGPGQGIDVGQAPLRVDMEVVVSALVAALGEEPRIDTGRLAFVGISFGGYLAVRVADRIGHLFRCVVNYSGGPRVAPFATLPRRLKDDFRFALRGGDDADMQARFDALALDVATPPATEVLSVHGVLDDIFPYPTVVDLDRAWGARHRLVAYESEAHVCLNRISECATVAADWVADRLVPAPVPAGRGGST